MKNKQLFSDFTKQYQLSKTLRFELVPQEETEKFIKRNGLLQQDEIRAEDYKNVKEFIDEYHKDFIESALKKVKLKTLQEYYDVFIKPEKDKNALNKPNETLRKEIAKLLKANPTKDEKKLIEETVPDFLKEQGRNEDAELVLKFKGFTTYFGGFNDNRKNIYSEKEQSTAISYRIVHENLPKFIGNMITFKHLIKNHKIDFSEVETQMETELNGKKLKDVFSLDFFNNCLTQSGIEKYNAIIGGKTDDKGKKTQGVNEKVNLFRQKNKLTSKQAPLQAPLYKQILSDRISSSYLPETLKSANELTKSIKDYYETAINKFEVNNEKKNVISELEILFSEKLNATDYDLSQIYIRNASITDASKQILGDHTVITSALNTFIEKKYKTKKEKNKQQKKGYFSISKIETALKEYLKNTEIENKEKREEVLKQVNPVLKYFNSLATNIEIAKDKRVKTNVMDYFRQKHEAVQAVLNREYENNSELIQDKEAVAAIKDYLDSYLHILHFAKPLFVAPPQKDESEAPDKDAAFYNEFDELFHQLNSVIPLYNKVRSFLTQKPYSTEKIKLNFENVQLLKGWDVNKETDNTSVIFRKDGLYYLGIMDKRHNDIFKNDKIPGLNEGEDYYEKMRYKLISGANKALPHALLSKKGINNFKPSEELMEKYERGTHKKGNDFSLKDCHDLIDYFKNSLKKYYENEDFNFKFSPTNKYEDISGFYKEVDNQGYKISFEKVSSSYIQQLVADGKLFLFKIYNKDFSPSSKGKPNLHTLYWKAVFDEDNLKDVVYKLDGEAEVFYRKKSIKGKAKVVHRKNKPIDNKNPLHQKKQSRFDYDIVKDKRYTEDKFQFHVPITLNFKTVKVPSDINRTKAFAFKFNDKVNQALKGNSEVNIIGIDRGERHLVYYSLINAKGMILEQASFNVIKNEYKGTKYETDYQAALVEKENARDAARKSWNTIGKIKELKEGYLSQVVHNITQLMIKHNAVVVLEDLNFGFKRGRFKVERQVYQKLEKMLIDKLNYLVFKDHAPIKPGGVLKAYQLSAPFTSFRDMGKQTGFIFYVPAANTSKIDFATGFINLLYPKYKNEKQAKEFFQKFDCIRFNPNLDKKYFEFVADYNKFITDNDEQLKRKEPWTICTFGKERFQYQPAKKKYSNINVTESMKILLKKHGIEYTSGKDIKAKITGVENAQFFKDLIFYLKLVLQMRYTDGKDRDFIHSPVANDNGVFFNSEYATDTEPKDADANGAYHIALKGLLQLHKIRKNEKKLAISKKEWQNFVQEQTYRK